MDRIRRSEAEDVVGLFIYDFDMDVDWNNGPHRLRVNNPHAAAPTHHRENQGNRPCKRDGAPRPGGGMLMRQQSQNQGFGGMGKRSSYENLMDASMTGNSGKKPHPVRKSSYAGNNPVSVRHAGSRETGVSVRHGGSRHGDSKPSVRIKRVSSNDNKLVDLVNNSGGSGSGSHREVSVHNSQRSNGAHTDNVPFSGSGKSNRGQQTSNLLTNNAGGNSTSGSGVDNNTDVVSAHAHAALELTSAEASFRIMNMSESHKSESSLPPLVLEKAMKDLTSNTGNTTNNGTANPNSNTITSSTIYHKKSSNLFGSESGSTVEAAGRIQKHESGLALDTVTVDNGTSDGNGNSTSQNTTAYNLMNPDNATSVVSTTHANTRGHAVTNGSATPGNNSHNNSHGNSHNNSHSNSRSNSRPGSRNGSFGYGQGEFLLAMEEGQPHVKKGSIIIIISIHTIRILSSHYFEDESIFVVLF